MLTFLTLVVALHSPAAAAPFAKVLSVNGLVSAEPRHVNLKAGAQLSEGDRITVMSDGLLRLKLENGEIVEVGPQSELSFHGTVSGARYLKLPHGSLLAVSSGPTPLEIRSGEIRLHLDGRAFFFEQRTDQHAYFCVCDGSASGKWGDSKFEVSGKLHHHGIFLSTTSSKAENGPPKPIDHDDEHLKELRALL